MGTNPKWPPRNHKNILIGHISYSRHDKSINKAYLYTFSGTKTPLVPLCIGKCKWQTYWL